MERVFICPVCNKRITYQGAEKVETCVHHRQSGLVRYDDDGNVVNIVVSAEFVVSYAAQYEDGQNANHIQSRK